MIAWFDDKGYIHVAAQSSAERLAMRYNREHNCDADHDGFILHEYRPEENSDKSDSGSFFDYK